MNPASEPTISVTRARRDEPVAERGSPARAAGAGLVVRAVIVSSSMRDFRFHIEDEEGSRERTPEMPLSRESSGRRHLGEAAGQEPAFRGGRRQLQRLPHSLTCLPGSPETAQRLGPPGVPQVRDRKSTRLNSSHGYISYAVFCL